MDRERKRLDVLAQERGHETTEKMFYSMYIVDRMPITQIAETLVTPLAMLRKRFEEVGITVRTRGGRHPTIVKIEVTQELVEEATRDGVRAVAERLGVDALGLSNRLRDYEKEKKCD